MISTPPWTLRSTQMCLPGGEVCYLLLRAMALVFSIGRWDVERDRDGERGEVAEEQGAHLFLSQVTQAAAQRRDREGGDAPGLRVLPERGEAEGDVMERAGGPASWQGPQEFTERPLVIAGGLLAF